MAKIPVKAPKAAPKKVTKRKPKGLVQLNPDGSPRHLPGATAQDVADMTRPPKRK